MINIQYADIQVPVELKPDTSVGHIKTKCCGAPVIKSIEPLTENTCEVTILQEVCIKIPIHYDIDTCIGDITIHCLDEKVE